MASSLRCWFIHLFENQRLVWETNKNLTIVSQSSRVHITRAVLEQFLSFAKYLDGLSHGAPLLKQLCDHILFNAAIWIHIPAKVSKVMSFPEDTQIHPHETWQQLGASEYTVMGTGSTEIVVTRSDEHTMMFTEVTIRHKCSHQNNKWVNLHGIAFFFSGDVTDFSFFLNPGHTLD